MHRKNEEGGGFLANGNQQNIGGTGSIFGNSMQRKTYSSEDVLANGRRLNNKRRRFWPMGCSKTVRLMGIMGNNEQGCFGQPMVTKRELKSCSYSAGLECCCSRNIMHTLDTLEISKRKNK